jgi:hypothetical protein
MKEIKRKGKQIKMKNMKTGKGKIKRGKRSESREIFRDFSSFTALSAAQAI